jgi:hypothetical protein
LAVVRRSFVFESFGVLLLTVKKWPLRSH